MNAKLIFSGIQPTGDINIGGYLGAIKNWVKMQHQTKSMFCVVDMHAITVWQDPIQLKKNTLKLIATYIACGLDYKTIPMYPQSMVPEHTELSWILGCLTPVGWLNRMTQFKSKSGSEKDKAGLGLYAYPVLMAADILIYKANIVPVGEDQTQHVELARDIAGAFNRAYGDYFPLPNAVINKQTMRIMSLRDPLNKMSKSDTADGSRINLTDSDDLIAAKIKKAVTDSEPTIYYDPDNRPAVTNLLNIFGAITGDDIENYGDKSQNTAEFKKSLSDVLIEHISPIRSEINRLILNDSAELEKIMREGASIARSIARNTISDVRKMVGLCDVWES
jgi:tryptophanyl-tRNA synthetase